LRRWAGSRRSSASSAARPEVHPLGETYFAQTAFRYGDYIAKVSLVPVSPGLTERTGDRVNVHGRQDALREDITKVLIEQGGTWKFRVQLCTDLKAMPVEDPTVVWDEKQSPFMTVATLTVDPQITWTHGRSEAQEDRLSFSPWHGLAAHRPLGAVNRARRTLYDFSADYRGRVNGCPVHREDARGSARLMTLRLKPLAGHIVAVTGGSSGIGLVTASEIAPRGARVVVDPRNEAALARDREGYPRLRW
jgi:hypothetical protein